jgi:hypothetical protein
VLDRDSRNSWRGSPVFAARPCCGEPLPARKEHVISAKTMPPIGLRSWSEPHFGYAHDLAWLTTWRLSQDPRFGSGLSTRRLSVANESTPGVTSHGALARAALADALKGSASVESDSAMGRRRSGHSSSTTPRPADGCPGDGLCGARVGTGRVPPAEVGAPDSPGCDTGRVARPAQGIPRHLCHVLLLGPRR